MYAYIGHVCLHREHLCCDKLETVIENLLVLIDYGGTVKSVYPYFLMYLKSQYVLFLPMQC